MAAKVIGRQARLVACLRLPVLAGGRPGELAGQNSLAKCVHSILDASQRPFNDPSGAAKLAVRWCDHLLSVP